MLNIPIADGALLFPYAVEVDEAKTRVARAACSVCFPDGRVDHIGFVVSPRGTVHIPMPDGDTVCCHNMLAGGWWAHDVVGGQGVGRTIRKFAAVREP